MDNPPLITRVVLENYKSIAFCDVKLGPLTILVGPNGAGKSNFLDALRLLSEAMNGPLEKAIYNRGDFPGVIRRGAEHLGVRIEFSTAGKARGYYSARFQRKGASDYVLEREACRISPGLGYEVQSGIFAHTDLGSPAPTLNPTQLHLPIMAAYPSFKLVSDLIANGHFYNLNPKDFRQPTPSVDAERALMDDGANLPNVVYRLEKKHPRIFERVTGYLSAINPALSSLETAARGGYTNIEFLVGDDNTFSPRQISDGTLRSLAVLVALAQRQSGLPVTLVGIEEPEIAIYPAAVGVLFDAMREASASVQVIATTHSADLLEEKEIQTEAIVAVEMCDGMTQIGHIDETGRKALKDRLYTAGGLMRMSYLRPELSHTLDSEIESVLFGDLVPA